MHFESDSDFSAEKRPNIDISARMAGSARKRRRDNKTNGGDYPGLWRPGEIDFGVWRLLDNNTDATFFKRGIPRFRAAGITSLSRKHRINSQLKGVISKRNITSGLGMNRAIRPEDRPYNRRTHSQRDCEYREIPKNIKK